MNRKQYHDFILAKYLLSGYSCRLCKYFRFKLHKQLYQMDESNCYACRNKNRSFAERMPKEFEPYSYQIKEYKCDEKLICKYFKLIEA